MRRLSTVLGPFPPHIGRPNPGGTVIGTRRGTCILRLFRIPAFHGLSSANDSKSGSGCEVGAISGAKESGRLRRNERSGEKDRGDARAVRVIPLGTRQRLPCYPCPLCAPFSLPLPPFPCPTPFISTYQSRVISHTGLPCNIFEFRLLTGSFAYKFVLNELFVYL